MKADSKPCISRVPLKNPAPVLVTKIAVVEPTDGKRYPCLFTRGVLSTVAYIVGAVTIPIDRRTPCGWGAPVLGPTCTAALWEVRTGKENPTVWVPVGGARPYLAPSPFHQNPHPVQQGMPQVGENLFSVAGEDWEPEGVTCRTQ